MSFSASMPLVPPILHQLDSCILLAPAKADEAAMAHGASLAAMVGAELPIHILIPDKEATQTSDSWTVRVPGCRIHSIPAEAGSLQTRTLARYLKENCILRPWLILWEPSLVRLATRAYAPAKAFVAGPWLMASAACMDAHRARIEQHLLHIYMSRQAGVTFSSDQSTDAFLRKELGYYGKILPRESWEREWKSERDLEIAKRAAETPHYNHKLEILVEFDTSTLRKSAHGEFINEWMQRSRHRVSLCRHAEDSDFEAALRSREEYDVLLRVCEPMTKEEPEPDWPSWHCHSGYKTMLIAQRAIDHHLWAERHGIHQVLSADALSGEDACAQLDELLSRQVHGLQHWVLQQPRLLIHHGVEATPVPAGIGGLDEVLEYQDYFARVLPSQIDPILAVLSGQRETLKELDEEIEKLEAAATKRGKGAPTLSALKQRLKSMFGKTHVA